MNRNWDVLDKNLIALIALEFDLPDIFRICQVNKRFNEAVCDSDNFWYKRIIQDYGFTPNGIENAKDKYQILKKYSKYDRGLKDAATKNYKDVADYFLKMGAVPDSGSEGASQGGHLDLLKYFYGMTRENGYKTLPGNFLFK